ncbi:endonuclease/exonuclease/phosphatase family protein [Pirellulimonas nuda]|nr:endonuclease/exonuclease/phosphatase family protein [Pirellulimonas nuda]
MTTLLAAATPVRGEESKPVRLRVATYNVSMYRDGPFQLASELFQEGSAQATRIAEVLQRVRPDIVLLNEFDRDYEKDWARRGFMGRRYLQRPQAGLEPIVYPHFYYAPVNTGVSSGIDLDRDGQVRGPNDAFGFGRYPGQYGMLLLSRFPIDHEASHAFSKLRWIDTSDAKLPIDSETGEHYYSEEALNVFRLPSKSFWDVCVRVPGSGGQPLHLLCSHPAPPVFDGPEDRNGKRNFDEIGLVAKYLSGLPDLFVDDEGKRVTPPTDEPCVVLGDLNADPVDGDGVAGAIQQLLEHPRIDSSFTPTSRGGAAASLATPEVNGAHRGDPAADTANFGGEGYANLRVDYVLPTRGIRVIDGGVYWPVAGEPGAEAIGATDHRLVWLDLELPATPCDAANKPGLPRRSPTSPPPALAPPAPR